MSLIAIVSHAGGARPATEPEGRAQRLANLEAGLLFVRDCVDELLGEVRAAAASEPVGAVGQTAAPDAPATTTEPPVSR